MKLHCEKAAISLVLAVLCAALLSACGGGGSDDDDTKGGGNGKTIPVTSTAKSPVVAIQQVTINSPPVVEFFVTDENGTAFIGVDNPRFTLAKLIPGSNGDTSRWQSYVNRLETAGNVGPGTENKVQATEDSANTGGVLENHGDGSYTYTFGTNVTQVTEPLAVSYQPELTHRLGMRFGGSETVPVTNATYTWRPADGATQGIALHDIVETQSCNGCHNDLAEHGGNRKEVKFCVTCHNPGTADANSGNTVDFKVMIHKIHRGAGLPSVQAGGKYSIYGFRDREHDFSHVKFPQDIRNCTVCHDAANPNTPQGGLWNSKPTMEACGSCHDNVNFALGKDGGHEGGVQTSNSDCTVCHAPGKFVGSIAESHQIPAQLAAQKFRFNLLSVENTGPGDNPVIRFSVTDPTNGNTAYNLQTHPAFTNLANRASRLFVDIAWDTRDYHNTDSGHPPAEPISLSALQFDPTKPSPVLANGDGSYTLTSSEVVPVSASGSGVVALEGHPAGDFDGDGTYSDRVPVKNVIKFFAITDAVPVARREVVDIAKCNACHGSLSLHGNNRTDEPQVCVACHNPNMTDIHVRPTDASGNHVPGVDGKIEQAVDFKTMIHSIHAAGFRENSFVVYGFRGSVNDFSDIGFPGEIGNCESCHLPGTYALPLASGVLGTTIDTADETTPDDDGNITPTAAVCSSCHDSTLIKAHMQQNGASFNTTQENIDNGTTVETCAVCHGPGKIQDVTAVHPIR